MTPYILILTINFEDEIEIEREENLTIRVISGRMNTNTHNTITPFSLSTTGNTTAKVAETPFSLSTTGNTTAKVAEKTKTLFNEEDFPDGLATFKKEKERHDAFFIETQNSKMNMKQKKSRRRKEKKRIQSEIETTDMIQRCHQIVDEIRELDNEGPIIGGYLIHLDGFRKVPPKYEEMKAELLELSSKLKKLGIDYLYRIGCEDEDFFEEDDEFFGEDDDIFVDHDEFFEQL